MVYFIKRPLKLTRVRILGEYTNECASCGALSLSSTHCGYPTSKPKCNLQRLGLAAYLCVRCNYVQIDKENVISHLKTQHDKDATPITTIENEYQEIEIIPPLKHIVAQADPDDDDRVPGISIIPIFLLGFFFRYKMFGLLFKQISFGAQSCTVLCTLSYLSQFSFAAYGVALACSNILFPSLDSFKYFSRFTPSPLATCEG